MLDFVAVIPARYASTRLPGKPLAQIDGVPMVIHVARRAATSGAAEVWIATDHEDVAEAAEMHGFRACMTAEHHASGTERIAEVASILGWGADRTIVNVQGDEPLIDPYLIRGVAEQLHRDPEIVMATACHPISGMNEMQNPHLVKVVLDKRQRALYFSRGMIPYARDAFIAEAGLPEGLPAYRHIGIYSYRAGFLKTYSELPPSQIEAFEALEQLRLLWHGHKIGVSIVNDAPAPGVDTHEDLEQVRKLFNYQG